MNLKRLITINEAIKQVLPKSYPRPKIVLFEDEESMLEVQGVSGRAFAVYDPNFNTISIPIKDSLALSDVDVAKLLLHEYCHARSHFKYGANSKQYLDELLCDKFACRWVKKLDMPNQDNTRFCGWRGEELEYLKAHYPHDTKDRITKRLDRSWAAIQSRASLLGVKREQKR
jgi:hypothetical protein